MTTHPHQHNSAIGEIQVSSNGWVDLLTGESPRLDETGTLAGVASIRLLRSDRRSTQQAHTLLRRSIGRLDSAHVLDEGQLCVFLAPIDGLTDLSVRVHELYDLLSKANLEATVGFAMRRQLEELLDTWARAEAELDRLTFRAERSRIDLSRPKS